jgi:hypothetical protein
MTRLALAWRALEREQRLAALTSLGLFVSMFLPWYSNTSTLVEHNAAKTGQASLSAFQAFSFVEAAVLLVSAGVLAMLFARTEGRDFQLPGGDGVTVMIAGGWTAVLIFYRLLDKPGLQGNQRLTSTVGVEWGIFIALLLALGLGYAGARMRAAARSAPPPARRGARGGRRAPGEDPAPGEPPPQEEITTLVPAPLPRARSTPVGARRRTASGRPRYPPAPSEQMSFEDAPPGSE